MNEICNPAAWPLSYIVLGEQYLGSLTPVGCREGGRST